MRGCCLLAPRSDKNGPFAGTYKMATPVVDAYCNTPHGRTWSLRYAVTPDAGGDFLAEFTFAPKLTKGSGGAIAWEVTDFDLEEGAGSEEHHELRLDHDSVADIAKAWYDNESAYAGDYAMDAPVLGAYCNNAQGTAWSIKYTTTPDAGGEVFVTFEFALKAVNQSSRGGGVAWEVVRMGEEDPSEKEPARADAAGQTTKRKRKKKKSAKAAAAGAGGRKSRGGGGAAASGKRRRGAEGGGAEQKKSRGGSPKGTAAGGDAEDLFAADSEEADDAAAAAAEEQAVGALYYSLDNEQPGAIALKLGIDISMLLELNKPRYKGLTAKAKLQPGTDHRSIKP